MLEQLVQVSWSCVCLLQADPLTRLLGVEKRRNAHYNENSKQLRELDGQIDAEKTRVRYCPTDSH